MSICWSPYPSPSSSVTFCKSLLIAYCLFLDLNYNTTSYTFAFTIPSAVLTKRPCLSISPSKPKCLFSSYQTTNQNENTRKNDNQGKFDKGRSSYDKNQNYEKTNNHKKELSSDYNDNKDYNTNPTQKKNVVPNRPTLPPPTSLNNELNRLRRWRNGVQRAERRLEEAVQDLIEFRQLQQQLGDDGDNTVKSKSSASTAEIVDDEFLPDLVSFNSVITSIAKSAKTDRTAAQRAEQWLRRMIELCKDFPQLKPTIFTYNAVMEGYYNTLATKPKFAEQALLRLFQEAQEQMPLVAYTYNMILRLNSPLLRAWQIAEEWVMNYDISKQIRVLRGNDDKHNDDDENNDTMPDRQSYSFLMATYAKVGDPEKAQKVLDIILLLDEERRKVGAKLRTHDVEPTFMHFAYALRALANSCPSNNDNDSSNGGATTTTTTAATIAEKADKLFAQLKELYNSTGSANLRPNTYLCNNLLNVHSKLGNVERLNEILEELETEYASDPDNNIDMMPDSITYTTVIKGYSVKLQKDADSLPTATAIELAENAEALLQKMHNLSESGQSKIAPTAVTYNVMIDIWTTFRTREGMRCATHLYHTMQRFDILPDSVTIATLIFGWSRVANAGGRSAEPAYRCEQFLLELEKLPPSRSSCNLSRQKIYTAVIGAWAKSGLPKAPDKVDGLYLSLQQKFLNGDKMACPELPTFIAMLDAYAKAPNGADDVINNNNNNVYNNNNNNNYNFDAVAQCEKIFQQMEYIQSTFDIEHTLEPNCALYNAALNVLAKSCQPQAIEKAEELLTLMQISQHEWLQPDIVTYATIIDCHTKCGTDASKRAEEILRFVEGSYRNGNLSLKPNRIFYSAILQAWAKTCTLEGAKKAEELLRRNIGLYEQGYDYAKPHILGYNAVMDAYARTGEVDAGKRAEELLEETLVLYRDGDDEMKPTRRSFNAVILAYRNCPDNGADKAEELLRQMENLADSGEVDVDPDVVTYNCVMGAIVDNEKDIDKAEIRVQALLKQMEERGVFPDGRTYACVVEAWLKRNDEKGHALADKALRQFLGQVESRKDSDGQYSLYEDAVWDVINTYRVEHEDNELSLPKPDPMLLQLSDPRSNF